MNSYPLRTRFAHDIVAEVIFPQKQTGRIAIFAMGLPSSLSKKGMLQFLANQGYVAIFFRYRGTWESDGEFLKNSPAQDVRDIVHDLEIKKSITDLSTNETWRVSVKEFHLFGSSFGGPAVLLNSSLLKVKKVVCISPVLDWTKEGRDEPFQRHIRFVQNAFGQAYRLHHKSNWEKLRQTKFYDPMKQMHSIDPKKVFILHAKDDMVVPLEPVQIFVKKMGVEFYLKPHGGHSLNFMHKFLWRKIDRFLRAR